MHCAAACCNTLQHSAMQRSAMQCSTAQYSKVPVRKLIVDGSVTVMVNYGLNLTDGTSVVQWMSVQLCELHSSGV